MFAFFLSRGEKKISSFCEIGVEGAGEGKFLFNITLEINILHTFSRPSSLRLITSKSKSVLKPLDLLKVILPVRPSQ